MSKLCSSDFYKKTPFNPETQTQIWMSQLADGHDNFCHCHCPFAHLLATIFPPGHQDRDLTINQILKRDYIEQCRSTGGEGENSGGERPDQGGGFKGIKEEQQEEEEEDLPEKELIDMLAAAAEDDTR
nr:MAG: ORF2 [Anelloviridae sp.]